MADYIEREALMKFPIRRDHYDRKNGNEHFINGIESVLDYAENLPSADVAPVVHGRWVIVDDGVMIGDSKHMECSVCNTWKKDRIKTDYCPNCGAKMDLEVIDNGQK